MRAEPTRWSWQPLHMRVSPGAVYVTLRMPCTAQPFSSSAWNRIGTFTGCSQNALPSSSTGTVPSTSFAPFWLPRPMRG